MLTFREASESLPGAAAGSSPRAGRDLPARWAGEVLPAAARPGNSRSPREKLTSIFSGTNVHWATAHISLESSSCPDSGERDKNSLPTKTRKIGN